MNSAVALQTDARPEAQIPARLKILGLASTFPHPLQTNLGIFVRARLQAMAGLADVKVVAPVAYLEFGNPARHGLGIGKIPPRAMDGALDVLRPRWQYLPNAGPVTAFLLALQMIRPFAALRRSFRYDLIDSHFAFPEGIAAALLSALFKCPYTITLRGNETDHSRYFFRGFAIRRTIRGADRVITVSERLREFAIECGAAPRKVITIPNGIDSAVYYPRPSREILKRYGIADDVPMVLSAGYLIERKGHHKVIRALRTLADRGCTAHLAIAGGPGAEGEYEPTLRRLVSDLNLEDRVHFLGSVAPQDLACLMSMASLLVLASSNEGWPNVVNEALACGLPVVATDIGAIPEMLPSEEYGFIVQPDDERGLAAAIERGLGRSWEREKIARWGASRSWGQVAAEVLQCFEDAIAEWRSKS
jgi:glycosyltransferase involved in cell wall biosynthesis